MYQPFEPAVSRITPRPLRLGFLALTDAAPFVVAQEQSFFVRHGLQVELSREVGWATIRDKILYGELDAAQAPAQMLWSTALGIGAAPCAVTTGLVLNLNGNALTLSERLWTAGVRDGDSLRREARRRSGEQKLTFGVVFMFSSHHMLLRGWLQSAGLNPDRDVRIVVVPPAQMFRNLAAGTIDGYCAGEPWNSLAVREKTGWCPTWSARQQPGHVEKVLMVTERFAQERTGEHLALIAALHDACRWCEEERNRTSLAALLARSAYINQSARVIAPALEGHFDCGHGTVEKVPGFHLFHGEGVNAPTLIRARAIQEEIMAAKLVPAGVPPQLTSRLFREDIFHQATRNTTLHELVS